MKGFSDLIEDLFRWLKEVGEELAGFLKDLSKNPVVQRLLDDLKKAVSASLRALWPAVKGSTEYVQKYFSGFKHKSLIFQFAVSAILSIVVIFVLFSAVLFQVADRFDRRQHLVNIPAGYGARRVADILIDAGIINNRYSYDLMVSFLGLENRIQAGVYKFSPSMPMGKVVWSLKRGEIVAPSMGKIVFPEGMSIYKMGEVLLRNGISDGERFKELVVDASDPDLTSKFPFLKDVKTRSLEGYLFPDTYMIPQDISLTGLRDMMLSRFDRVVMPVWDKSSRDTNLTLHEIVTLASIIEKEAAVDEERALISSVFHNRLSKRMHLGADPTVKYALSEFRKPTKKVFYIDLEIDSPYNTYKYIGLPPGPICNPGLASIVAAIYPAKTDYLYFVARKDGTHIFSVTWQEHEKAKVLVRGQ
jgi:UPF0755 protein